MPKYNTNYEKTIIYKIVCEDSNIRDCYVGHTTDFNNRKSIHKYDCNNPKTKNNKLYRIINDNGGWDNWRMVMIEKYPCKDKLEAGEREYYWYKTLNATLNTKTPKCENIKTRESQMNYRKHYSSIAYILETFIKSHIKIVKLRLRLRF